MVSDFVGEHRNTPKRNLDFSNLGPKTSIFQIWSKCSACSDAHPKKSETTFVNQLYSCFTNVVSKFLQHPHRANCSTTALTQETEILVY